MTASDSITQANRALTEAPGGVELPTDVLNACGDRSNVASYLTGLRGCDQPTRYATAASISAARELGGR
jgi:hypothetical protein